VTAGWDGLVDLQRLAGWMQQQGLGAGPVQDARLLAGGTQNVLLSFSNDGRRFVLRRPPAVPRPQSNQTMRREPRLLRALATTDVPHPRLIAACETEDVLGVAFYLMEPVDGFNATVGLPLSHRDRPDLRHRMGLALIDGIIQLGRVDPVAVGLDGFGRAEGFLERQVGRWAAQLESFAEYPGWAGPQSIPGVARVTAWLHDHRPRDFQPGIMHGDYHLANVMFRPDSAELAAIVDWELATIGDPLLDLGWLLATWPAQDGSGGSFDVQPWAGFPTEPELVARYAAAGTRDLGALDWYVVLACYKLGILQEGTTARAPAGKAPIEVGQRLHEVTVRLFERALRRIG
jgi:aminoglycoside phosphotransferase (APT) family kinase protein